MSCWIVVCLSCYSSFVRWLDGVHVVQERAKGGLVHAVMCLCAFAARVACKAEANLAKKVAAASVAIPAFVASHPAFALVRDSQPDCSARTRF